MGPSLFIAVPMPCGAEAMEALNEFGTMIKSPSGYPVQSPWVAILSRQAEVMLRIASEFGFSPASRSRHFMYTKHISMLLDSSDEPGSAELSEHSYFGSLEAPSRNSD